MIGWKRNIDRLYIHKDTLGCAMKGCVVCCYKVVIYKQDGMKSNIRPEECVRVKSRVQGNTPHLYDKKGLKILIVGDGNFSFSLSVMEQYQDSIEYLIATSHESKQSVLCTYPESKLILEKLSKFKNVHVSHDIDATDAEHLKQFDYTFDRIVWNFPCVRIASGLDGQNEEMERNKSLLVDFFKACRSVLHPANGEIHITHKTKGSFQQWNIIQLANTLCHYLGSIIFDKVLYPGYTNKKVLSNKSFPIFDSQTYIFTLAKHKTLDLPNCIPLQQQHIQKLTTLLLSETNQHKRRKLN